MSLKTTIEADIKKAMLAQDRTTLRALRSIKSLILLAESEKGAEGELEPEKEMALLMKAAKQRRDSAEIYEQQDRQDLLETEVNELRVIELYLPKQLSDEEVKEIVAEIIAKVGATGPQDLGKVMGAASSQLKGKAEGKAISTAAKELLAK